jgi:hypothetical protein
VLAVPGIKPGTIHIELFDLKHKQLIQAHNNALTQIVLNNEGSRLASASEKVPSPHKSKIEKNKPKQKKNVQNSYWPSTSKRRELSFAFSTQRLEIC